MTNAISMDGLTKHYKGVQALTDLTLDVPAGTVFGFLGPNGAGKTTALKVLAGLARATSGSATVNGIAVSAAGEHRRQLGYLAQDPRFYGWMTGRETLRYVASFRGIGADRERQITELLGRVGIADAADRRTSTYSGGMRQRLGIAQALVGRPAVILLDEPVSALDPIGRKDVLDLMRELKGETTVFYSTHILDDVQRVSDHVAILDHGRLVKAAPTHVLLGSFTANTLRVVLGGAQNATEVGMRQIPGVASVTVVSRSGDETAYDVVTQVGASAAVQREVTLFAVNAGLTLIANAEETLDLETVFLRLIDPRRWRHDRLPDARPAGSIRRAIARHPIAAFLVITFASTWAMTGLLSVSLLFGLVALFGPTAGAVIVSWADGSLVELRERLTTWRTPRSFLIALGIPFAVSGAAAVLWTISGHGAPGLGAVSALELVIFVLVIGEEIGWRGFLLPRLRGHLSLPAAGLVSGIVWTLWHLPLYLQPGQGLVAFVAFTWWVIPFARAHGVRRRARAVQRPRGHRHARRREHRAPDPAAGCRPHLDARRHRNALRDRRRSARHPLSRHEPSDPAWLGSTRRR